MRIPIKALRQMAKDYGLSHVVVFGYDGKQQHVATYGKSIIHCDEAAQFGNRLKDELKWPESLHADPPRVKQLQKRIKELEAQLSEAKESK